MVYCPICSNSEAKLWAVARDFEYYTSKEDFLYYECPACSSLFIDPVPVSRLKDIYPSNYYSFVTSKKNLVTLIKEWLDKLFFRSMLRLIPESKIHLLDVGGGTGWLASHIKAMDPRIVRTQIVDIDGNAKIAAEASGHLYFEGLLEEFEPDQKYELILLINLIEHLADPLTVLNKASRLLSPSGIILVKTPNILSLDARLFKNSYWGGLHSPRHWRIFSEKSFRLLLEKTNLAVHSLTYTQGGSFWGI